MSANLEAKTPDTKTVLQPLEAHLFVCTNVKPSGECCGLKDAGLLRDELKKWAKDAHPEWSGKVRVNAAGCLGHCKRGIAAVIYPEGRWFVGLKREDHAVLKEALEASLKPLAKAAIENDHHSRESVSQRRGGSGDGE